ncbi:hypothetical protein N9X30_02195 [Gammaproteobacteria bacterium]|nr:hypothetical protein [Gammaproteobacteria bacterium]
MKIKSLLVGASGLVGSEILKYLHERDQDITIFTRKPLHDSTDKHKEINIDFENLNNFDFPYFDHVYIAIGMKLDTVELIHIKKNKRKEFFRVDHDTIFSIAKKAFDSGARSISVVSAIGADMNSKNFYLQTKGKIENSIKQIGYEKVVFAQPSHLLGSRPNDKIRIEVPIIELGAKIIDPLMIGPLSDLRFIKASCVAKAMINTLNEGSENLTRLKFKDFKTY